MPSADLFDLYDGPYKILTRSDKHFTLDIQGTRKVVSLDRLKPAHMELAAVPQDTANPPSSTASTSSVPPPRITRSGRHVRWPDRLQY